MKTDSQWNRIGRKHHHGIAVSLSSLRTKKSCGIGEFLDLPPLIDWCAEIGLDTIQLLPLYDSGNDPSPYNALSSVALNPIYLSLAALDGSSLEPFAPLTQLDRVFFADVRTKKMDWLRGHFERHFDPQSPSYLEFLAAHPWVDPFSRFKTLKKKYDQKNWIHWPKDDTTPPDPIDVSFYSYLQYLCHLQMRQVRAHADKKKVFLKGDIPVSLSPDSADVWAEPHLFDLTVAAGAPPDFYNKQGQRWGFPLFNWDAMKRDNYRWWRRRLQSASEYFHLYRIDHVVGFFRIWAIPETKKASEGFFVPQNPDLWPEHGRSLLEMMIDASPMLPIAEDLGTIPKYVPEILKQLGICGTKIIRWERRWDTDRNYIPYDQYEPYSLTSVSTHDSDTLTQWWDHFPEEASAFARFKRWTYQPGLAREQRFEILRDSHHTASFFHINLLQETLALFPPLVWPNPEDQRLNIPGTQLLTNWTYRYRVTIEEMVAHPELTATFKELIQ